MRRAIVPRLMPAPGQPLFTTIDHSLEPAISPGSMPCQGGRQTDRSILIEGGRADDHADDALPVRAPAAGGPVAGTGGLGRVDQYLSRVNI
jgi:hypothetical protein